jgi:hypothetical protein
MSELHRASGGPLAWRDFDAVERDIRNLQLAGPAAPGFRRARRSRPESVDDTVREQPRRRHPAHRPERAADVRPAAGADTISTSRLLFPCHLGSPSSHPGSAGRSVGPAAASGKERVPSCPSKSFPRVRRWVLRSGASTWLNRSTTRRSPQSNRPTPLTESCSSGISGSRHRSKWPSPDASARSSSTCSASAGACPEVRRSSWSRTSPRTDGRSGFVARARTGTATCATPPAAARDDAVRHRSPELRGLPLGDTEFASTAAAWDALPQSLREWIDGRRVTFDFCGRKRSFPPTEAEIARFPPVSTPSPGPTPRADARACT